MDKIKMIKKDAVIEIKIGAGFLQQIQKLLLYIVSDLTPEKLQQYQKEAESFKDKLEFSEDWMEHLTTLSIIIREIEKCAEEQGFIYEQDLESFNSKES